MVLEKRGVGETLKPPPWGEGKGGYHGSPPPEQRGSNGKKSVLAMKKEKGKGRPKTPC